MTTQPIKWEEAQRLLRELEQDIPDGGGPVLWVHIQNLMLCTIGFYLGFRLSDILKFKWKDLKDEMVEVLEQKTQKIRIIDTRHPEFRRIIKKCKSLLPERQTQPEARLFFSTRGTRAYSPLQYSGTNKRLRNLFQKYNIETEKETSHTLRKTYTRRKQEKLIEKYGKENGSSIERLGYPIHGDPFIKSLYVVGYDLNHKDVFTTMVYLGYTYEDSRWAQQNL